MDFGRYVFDAPYFGWLCWGVLLTWVSSVLSVCFAAIIGLLVVQCQISARRTLRVIGAGFVIVFRNLPLVPLLLFLTFGLPGLWMGLWRAPFPRGLEFLLLILGLALNAGAYVAEILRAGVAAVPPEQIDAARMLGLSRARILRRVIYPQAVRIVAPSLASRAVHTVKNSTLALVVPLPLELMEVVGQAGRIAGETFAWAEPLLFAACAHLLLSLGLDWLLNHWASREQVKIGVGP
ncbi:MAG: ABC transporter permease subunit [Chloroflexales bacterium]|nr:ABC transporter permease subunit [Chloroflexales bacterium]